MLRKPGKTELPARILYVEQSSFVPLLCSSTVGAEPGATEVMQQRAVKIGEKNGIQMPTP